jgi:hypothetical protein
MYYVPAFALLALHAAVANHYTRYNLILIGPFSIGASIRSARVDEKIPCTAALVRGCITAKAGFGSR